jgi:Flp pilus assembly protein TadD
MSLALGACSGLTPREDLARRPPSLRIAKAALDSGAPQLALQVADLELAKQPNDVSALVARGDALYALGQRDQAQLAYRAAVQLEPDTTAAQVGLGRTLAQSDPHAAETVFLSALSRDPDNVTALNNLGVVRDLQGRHTEAQEAYTHAISIAPMSADVQINLGMSLALSARTSEASRLLRGIASDPEARQAWRKELTNALTLAGDGAWAQQELPIDSTQPLPDKTLVAESGEPPIKGASPGIKAANHTMDTPVTAPSEPRPIPAVAADPREPVVASSLPAISGGRDRSANKTIVSSPALAEAMLDTSRPAMTPSDVIAGLAERLPVATVSGPEDAAQRYTDTGDDDFYVQVASLTSEAGAFFEWDRLKRRLPRLLGDRDPTVTPAEARGRMYWRLRTFGFPSSLGAKQMCRQLEEHNLHCWTGRGI